MPQQSHAKEHHPQQVSQLGKLMGVTYYVNGQSRRVDRIRTPLGTDAQALQKHTCTRLLVAANRRGVNDRGDGKGYRSLGKNYRNC